MSTARLPIGMFAFHTHDAAALAAFWARFLDLAVDDHASPAFATIGFDADGPTWMFHWPAGSSPDAPAPLSKEPNRFMLDFVGGPDWRDETRRAVALGATHVADHEFSGAQWAELADPDGNTFRVWGPRP